VKGWPFPGFGIARAYTDANGVRWHPVNERPMVEGEEDEELRNTRDVEARADNAYELGTAPRRFMQVRTATGVMGASDAREKATVRALSADELKAAVVLSRGVRMYQWADAVARKGAANARWHVGMTVQAAIGTLSAAGVDAMRLAFICHDVFAGGGDRYSFRSNQLSDFIIAGLSERVRVLEAAASAAAAQRFAKRYVTTADGKATFNPPAAGMVLSITPRTAGAVIDSVSESVAADGKVTTSVSFRKLRTNGISLGGLLQISLFETSPGAVTFDVVATPASP